MFPSKYGVMDIQLTPLLAAVRTTTDAEVIGRHVHTRVDMYQRSGLADAS